LLSRFRSFNYTVYLCARLKQIIIEFSVVFHVVKNNGKDDGTEEGREETE